MKLFNRKKEELQYSATYPPYWSENQFGALTKRFATNGATLQFNVTSISHRLELGNPRGQIIDSEFIHELRLSGRSVESDARLECKFLLLPNEIIEREYHGYLHLSSNLDSSRENSVRKPVFYARFNVRSTEHLDELRRTLQPALLQPGLEQHSSAYITFYLKAVENIDEWISDFASQHYSPNIVIRAMSASTEMSKMGRW